MWRRRTSGSERPSGTHATAATTPLVAAVQRRDVAAVQLALEGGADVNQRDGDGWPPLHSACYGTCDDGIAALLVRWGADVASVDKWQRTPLWYACSYGRHATAMLLLAVCDGADLWRADVGGRTPLPQCMIATGIGSTGKTAIAKALLSTPGFMTPLPRVIAAVEMADRYSAPTPARPLVLRAIAQQENWLRRRTLLLLRKLADTGRARWRCRCTDCVRRRWRKAVGVAAVVAVHRQHVAYPRDNRTKYVGASC